MRTSRKLLAWLGVVIATLLLLGVNGWFGLALIVAVPVSILYWFDYGRELRDIASPSRARRWLGLAMGVPQAILGLACLGLGIAAVGWALYSVLWKSPRDYGAVFSVAMAAFALPIGFALVVDAFALKPLLDKRSEPSWVSPPIGLSDTAGFDRYYVWEIISYAWTEIGIEDRECVELVRKGRITRDDLREVDRIIFRDVCASFAIESFLILPCMLWMLMPDWGYDEGYLRRRMGRWHAMPFWRHALNPFRWLGYPTAVLFALSYRSMLRWAVRASVPDAAS